MSEPLPRVVVEFCDGDALRAEVDANLQQGGAMAPGETSVEERTRCQLVLVHPETGSELVLVAEVVYVKRDGSDTGSGLQLVGFDDEMLARIRAFTAERAAPEPATPATPKQGQNVHERVRSLTQQEARKLARTGNYAERLALERAYGKAVWELLIQNPRLTHPEVARIARMGTLPGPQVEAIATNPAWLASPEVRRALLGNPRVTGPLIDKVLRALPKHELQQVPKQSCYSTQVRNLARSMLSRR